MAEDFDELLKKDPRYKLGAYEFVMESLNYAQNGLNLGTQRSFDGLWDNEDEPPVEAALHITGPQLCDAMRKYAIKQYGYLALPVLNSWGIASTNDFGQVVFNLVKCEKLLTSPEDRIEDFDNVYDFRKAFGEDFEFD